MKQIILYTQEEAEAAVAAIKTSIANTRRLIVDFYEREGWKALGYDSFETCIRSEFKLSVSQVYRELKAGVIERDLPIGEIGSNRESHLRRLGILDTNDQKERAYMLAQAMSDDPTAETFDTAAKFVWVEDNASDRVVDAMKSGNLSPMQAFLISKYLKGKPDDFSNVATKVRDPELLPAMYRLYNEDSATWREITMTGHIPSVDRQIPLERAAAENLSAYLNIASNEHRAAAIVERQERYDAIRECVDDIIAAARLVDEHEYPELYACIQAYDRVVGNIKVIS